MNILAATAALALVVTPAQERNWPSSGGFDIIQLDTACVLSASYEFDGRAPVELSIFFGGEEASLLLTSLDWSSRSGEEYEIDYLLGEVGYSGNAVGMISDYVHKGFVAKFGPDFLDAFARAPSLLVTRGEVVVTHLSLRASSSAVTTLRRCAEHVARANADQARREERWNYITADPFAGPRPPTEPERPSVIVNPAWARMPTPGFPDGALSRGIRCGSVSLSCEAQPNGSLTGCSITAEDPAGAGFGQAAITSARAARVSPSALDRAAPRPRVDFTLRFVAE